MNKKYYKGLCLSIVLAFAISHSFAQTGVGAKPEKGAKLYLDGTKKSLTKNWEYWEGPNSGLDGGNDGGKGITDTPGGLKLQAEGHDVYFRNVWIKKLNLDDKSTDF